MNQTTSLFNRTLLPMLAICAAMVATASAGEPAKEVEKIEVVEPESPWRISLSSPGWMAGLYGDLGLGGTTANLDVTFRDIFNKIDMAASFRAQVLYNHIGLGGDYFYASLSDSLGQDGLVRNVNVRADITVADMEAVWRVAEGKWGFAELRAGCRFQSLYSTTGFDRNRDAISDASNKLVDAAASRVRNALEDALKGALDGGVDLPIPPLTPVQKLKLIEAIRRIRDDENLRKELRSGVADRVEKAKRTLAKRIDKALNKALSQTLSLYEDWWDPYVGFRVRYNITRVIYAKLAADIGGFGVGSDLSWQAEGALGCQVTRNITAEAGYRALWANYSNDDFSYKAYLAGFEVTVGVEF